MNEQSDPHKSITQAWRSWLTHGLQVEEDIRIGHNDRRFSRGDHDRAAVGCMRLLARPVQMEPSPEHVICAEANERSSEARATFQSRLRAS